MACQGSRRAPTATRGDQAAMNQHHAHAHDHDGSATAHHGCCGSHAGKPALATDPAAAGPDAIYTCPMHPEIRQDRARQLPDLRHGAGAARDHRRGGAQPRTRRHDPPLLDRPGADRCRCSSWRWAAISRARPARPRPAAASRPGCSSCCATPVVLWAGLAILPARLGVAGEPQPQHVHPDRARDRRRLPLQRGRHPRAGAFPGRLPRHGRHRSRSISRPPPSSPSWCCSARCWNCGRASRPAAPSAPCSTWRPRPPAASRDGRRRRGDPARRRAGRRSAARPPRRWRAGGRRGAGGQQRGRRNHGHGRVHAGREAARRQAHWRHGERHRRAGHARGQDRLRHHAGAHRRHGGRGAAQPRADPAHGRHGGGLFRPGGDRHRRRWPSSPGRSGARRRRWPMR